jgi:hypothetical protein
MTIGSTMIDTIAIIDSARIVRMMTDGHLERQMRPSGARAILFKAGSVRLTGFPVTVTTTAANAVEMGLPESLEIRGRPRIGWNRKAAVRLDQAT